MATTLDGVKPLNIVNVARTCYASINNQWRPMNWSTCAVTHALLGGASAAWSVILYHLVAVFMPKFKVGCPCFRSHRANPEQWLETQSWRLLRSETNRGNTSAPNVHLDQYPTSTMSSGVEQGADPPQSTDPATGECYFLMGLQPDRGNGFWWVPAWTIHTYLVPAISFAPSLSAGT